MVITTAGMWIVRLIRNHNTKLLLVQNWYSISMDTILQRLKNIQRNFRVEYGRFWISVYRTSFPETFGIVGSSCGALDFRTFNEGYNNYQVDKVLYPLSSLNSEYILSDSTDKMLNTGQYYILDCGINDFLSVRIRVFIRNCSAKN